MNRIIFLIGAMAIALPSVTFAAIIHVPADQPTIQDGIDAAVYGDTVLVADGTYNGEGNKNITFRGKAIQVVSESGPESCIVDCENDGRGFVFNCNENSDSVLQGLTIQNGHLYYDCPGIFFYQSSPTLIHCIITDNRSVGSGGGVECNNSSPSFLDCIIKNNSSQDGAGIYCQENSSPLLTNCRITENQAHLVSGSGSLGGGIECINSSPTLINCIISNNYADVGGGIGCVLSSPSVVNCTINENPGGGIYCRSSSAEVINCHIEKNNSSSNKGGGGICCIDSSDPLRIINCIISNNTTNTGSYYSKYGGGGVFVDNSSLEINNCLINENLSNSRNEDGVGGAIACWSSSIRITNSTFVGNSSKSEAGGIYNNSSVLSVINTIIWSNTPDQISGAADLKYCNIQYGFPGAGNTNSDPLFIGGDPFDFHLLPNSPCIDAGTDQNAPSEDLDGNTRPQGGAVDMGAYEFVGWPSLNRSYITMPAHTFTTGDTASCSVTVWNAGNSTLAGYPLFTILYVMGNLYFAPSFTSYDYFKWSFPAGLTELTVIPDFTWPNNAGSASDIVWYSFLTNPEMTELVTPISAFDFGWSE